MKERERLAVNEEGDQCGEPCLNEVAKTDGRNWRVFCASVVTWLGDCDRVGDASARERSTTGSRDINTMQAALASTTQAQAQAQPQGQSQPPPHQRASLSSSSHPLHLDLAHSSAFTSSSSSPSPTLTLDSGGAESEEGPGSTTEAGQLDPRAQLAPSSTPTAPRPGSAGGVARDRGPVVVLGSAP